MACSISYFSEINLDITLFLSQEDNKDGLMYKDYNRKVSVVGLGYVGLPVAVEFGRISETIGFDINLGRIEELKQGIDRTGEVEHDYLVGSHVIFTSSFEDLKKADFHIVAVPTPVDENKRPDFTPLIKSSETVGKILKKGDIVVYESTVFPGATEEICLPILEKISGLQAGVDFKVGYSPERINPGDKEHRLTTIKKVVSAQDEESLDIVASTYAKVITAGVHKTGSIKAAEAAKVIENTQRDINIALMNELAIIFKLVGVDTREVLDAAATKWNFIPFSPGLVGGHCIGVDPYYLTFKAESLGYHPEVILAGRRINDNMGKFVAQQTIKEMIKSGQDVAGSTVTVLGFTFKENCPDIRNTKVVDIIKELKEYNVKVQVYDPIADYNEAYEEYKITLNQFDELKPATAVIAAVGHKQFSEMSPEQIKKLCKGKPVLIDVKSMFDAKKYTDAGIHLWRL